MLAELQPILTREDIKEIERLKRMVIRGVTTSLKKEYGKNFNVKNYLNRYRPILTRRDLEYFNYEWFQGDIKIAVCIMAQTTLYILNELSRGNNCGLGEISLEIKDGNVTGIMCIFKDPLVGMFSANNSGVNCEV